MRGESVGTQGSGWGPVRAHALNSLNTNTFITRLGAVAFRLDVVHVSIPDATLWIILLAPSAIRNKVARERDSDEGLDNGH
jgi:hypothetical protein